MDQAFLASVKREGDTLVLPLSVGVDRTLQRAMHVSGGRVVLITSRLSCNFHVDFEMPHGDLRVYHSKDQYGTTKYTYTDQKISSIFSFPLIAAQIVDQRAMLEAGTRVDMHSIAGGMDQYHYPVVLDLSGSTAKVLSINALQPSDPFKSVIHAQSLTTHMTVTMARRDPAEISFGGLLSPFRGTFEYIGDLARQ